MLTTLAATVMFSTHNLPALQEAVNDKCREEQCYILTREEMLQHTQRARAVGIAYCLDKQNAQKTECTNPIPRPQP